MQAWRLTIVADAGRNPETEALDDGGAIGPLAGREHGPGLERAGIEPGNACRAAIGDENFAIVRDGTGRARKSRQRRDVTPGVGIDHLDRALSGVGDEDTAGPRIEDAVIESAPRGAGILDRAQILQRHDDLMPLFCVPAPDCSVHVQSPRKGRALHRARTVKPVWRGAVFPRE